MTSKTPRKIIQICTQVVQCGESGYSAIHALCNDGSVWVMETYQPWVMLEPIPQDDIEENDG